MTSFVTVIGNKLLDPIKHNFLL